MDEDGKLYFIEVNARIQVEHPVTEIVTGIDLVKARSASRRARACPTFWTCRSSGAAMPSSAASTPRIPRRSRPRRDASPGFNLPGGIGVRVDTHAYTDGVIPPYYDSLVAKLIVHGRDRTEAIRRMRRALSMFIVEGIHTSIPLHQKILADPDFVAGKFDTNFIKRFGKH